MEVENGCNWKVTTIGPIFHFHDYRRKGNCFAESHPSPWHSFPPAPSLRWSIPNSWDAVLIDPRLEMSWRNPWRNVTPGPRCKAPKALIVLGNLVDPCISCYQLLCLGRFMYQPCAKRVPYREVWWLLLGFSVNDIVKSNWWYCSPIQSSDPPAFIKLPSCSIGSPR